MLLQSMTCPAGFRKKPEQLQDYYEMLGGAPGTLDTPIFILGIAMCLGSTFNPGLSSDKERSNTFKGHTV